MKQELYKTGIGYDIHKFIRNRKLVLGGVKIPYSQGLYGHSDADVVIHSISDAILGAIGLDDIGTYFPNTDIKYKNISSKIILEKVYKMCTKKGYNIINIDCMIIAEEPKISKYKKLMKRNISKIVKSKNISIKATSNEGLGLIGKKQGIACISIVTVKYG
jgi:2-C-methyl-D-erythritol 2,4-cyclodiphosphate synthase